MQVVAFVNQKGGVGKTTVCRTLCSMLAKNGKKVLVIDLDPQQSLSLSVGVVEDRFDYQTPSIYNVLSEDMPIEQAILGMDEGYDIVRADNRLYSYTGEEIIKLDDIPNFADDPTGLHNYIMNKYRRLTDPSTDDKHKLRRQIERIAQYYDFVLCDTNPDLGWTLTSVLMSAPVVNLIVPAFAEDSSREAIIALDKSIKTIMAHDLSQKINILGVLIARYENNNLSKHYVDFLSQTAKAIGTSLFNTLIPKSVAVPEAMAFKDDLFECRGGTILSQYTNFYNEFIERIEAVNS